MTIPSEDVSEILKGPIRIRCLKKTVVHTLKKAYKIFEFHLLIDLISFLKQIQHSIREIR